MTTDPDSPEESENKQQPEANQTASSDHSDAPQERSVRDKPKVNFTATIDRLQKRAGSARSEYKRNKLYLSITGVLAIAALLMVVVYGDTIVQQGAASLKQERLVDVNKAADDANKELATAKGKQAEANGNSETAKQKLKAARAANEAAQEAYRQTQGFGNIRSLWLTADGSAGWAVGKSGTVLRYADGQWQLDEQASAVTEDILYSLWLTADGSAGWAAGRGGTVLRYADGQWQLDEQASAVTGSRLLSLWLTADGSAGWAVGTSTSTRGGTRGTVLRYADDQWQLDEQASAVTGSSLYSLWLTADGNAGWAVGYNGTVLRYADGQWQLDEQASAVTEDTLRSLWLTADGNAGWAAGRGGTVLRYADGQWQLDEQASAVTEDSLLSLWLTADGKAGWAVGYNGTVLRYADGQWQLDEQASAVTEYILYSLWLTADGSAGWAMGNNGTVLRYADENWSEIGSDVKTKMAKVKAKVEESAIALEEARSNEINAEGALAVGNSAVSTAEEKALRMNEAAKAVEKAIGGIRDSESSITEIITRGGAISGAIGLAVFLMQIFLQSLRYFARLAEYYDAQADALTAAAGDSELAVVLLQHLSPLPIEFGKTPTHIYGKVLEALGGIAQSKTRV